MSARAAVYLGGDVIDEFGMLKERWFFEKY
jgi:hypothetical protein